MHLTEWEVQFLVGIIDKEMQQSHAKIPSHVFLDEEKLRDRLDKHRAFINRVDELKTKIKLAKESE